MPKMLKVEDSTHERLSLQGNVGDSYDTVINRLIDTSTKNNILILYRLTNNKEKPSELYLLNSFFWTDQNYKKFFEFAIQIDNHFVRELFKTIASNDEYYNTIKQYRKDLKLNE